MFSIMKMKKIEIPILWSLIFSVFIHIIGFFLFQIDIGLRGNPIKRNLIRVTFIGSILPSFTSSHLTNIKTVNSIPKYNPIKISDKISPDVFSNKRILQLSECQKINADIADNDVINTIQEFNVSLADNTKKSFTLDNINEFFIGDSFENRRLIYKPNIRELNDLTLLYSNFGIVMLRIAIIPNGKVSKVDIIKTSGDSFIDIALKNYFRKCIFEPIFSDRIQIRNVKFDLAKVSK